MGESAFVLFDRFVKICVNCALILSSYFQDVLQSPLLSTDDNEIQLHKDGSWSTHVEKNGSCLLESPQKPVAVAQKVEVISLDLDSTAETASPQNCVQSNMLKMCLRNGAAASGGEATGGGNGNEAANNGGDNQQQQQQQPSNDTVDLTLSDSDDDGGEAPQRDGGMQRRAAGKR